MPLFAADSSPYPLVWKPNPDDVASSSFDRFRRKLNAQYNLALATYDDVHAFSVNELEKFWAAVWHFVGVRASQRFDRVLSDPKARPIDLPTWFEGARYSLAENVLFPLHPSNATACSPGAPYHWPPNNATAVIQVPEGGGLAESASHLKPVPVTWGELRRRVALLAETLRRAGVRANDRIAHVSANTVTPIVAGLAANSIGAIFSLIATDSGPDAIYARVAQIRPSLLFTDDVVVYNGKQINVLDRVADVADRLRRESNVDADKFHVVVIRNPRAAANPPAWKSSLVPAMDMGAFVRSVGLAETDSPAHRFEQLPAQHPLQIFFSSGTTGEPKCIIHSQAMLLNMKKESLLHYDTRPNDSFLQITTCGWIMWTYHYVSLACGGTTVAYDGSPLYPNALHIVRLVAELRLTGFGASPRFLSELEKHVSATGYVPRRKLDLSRLRYATSTGSPLSAANVRFFYAAFPGGAHLSSISGGTDLAGVICGPAPVLPLYGHLMQVANLGMDLQVWDAHSGARIGATEARAGELVLARPFPTQPLGFFGPDDKRAALRAKYIDSYYARFPDAGVWAQGDFIVRDAQARGWEILGRSDGVLNPSGVRFGSAEIYAVLERFPFVADSIVVGQHRRNRDQHEQVLLFVKMRHPAASLTDAQVAEIKSAIRSAYSARHVPAHIFQVKDIPVTLNGKKTELAVKAIVCGNTDFTPSSATANPECLDEYRQYAEIESVLRKRGARL